MSKKEMQEQLIELTKSLNSLRRELRNLPDDKSKPELQKGWPVKGRDEDEEEWQTGHFFKGIDNGHGLPWYDVLNRSGGDDCFRQCELDTSIETVIGWIPHLTGEAPEGFGKGDKVLLKYSDGLWGNFQFNSFSKTWRNGEIVAYARPVDNWGK